tara:strand:+ start:346 stop:543 length:198 start_codon:yes stop_codon:yes gene_type:complete
MNEMVKRPVDERTGKEKSDIQIAVEGSQMKGNLKGKVISPTNSKIYTGRVYSPNVKIRKPDFYDI